MTEELPDKTSAKEQPKVLSMISQTEKELVKSIQKLLEKEAVKEINQIFAPCCFEWQFIELLDNLVKRLEIAPHSYRPCSEEDSKKNFYTAKCDKCGWWGSSKLLEGGGQIADTGDYSDCYCPVCGNNSIEEL